MVPYSNYEFWKTTPIEGEPYLSVVVPTVNADETLVHAIGAIALHVSGLGFPWELIVVDDGTNGQAVQTIYALEFANLRVLEIPGSSGKGSIVQCGMLAARGRYVLLTDTSNPPPVEDIERLLYTLQYEGYDVAIASPIPEEVEEEHRSWLWRMVHSSFHWVMHNLFFITTQDIQYGFTLFRRKAARHLHLLQTIMGLSFNLEILYLAFKLGYKVAEVPVNWCCSQDRKVSLNRRAVRMLIDLITIKQNDQNGVYDVSLPWSDYLNDTEYGVQPALNKVNQRASLPS